MPIELLATLPSVLSSVALATPRVMVAFLLIPLFIFRDLQPLLRVAIGMAVAMPVAAGIFMEHQVVSPGPAIMTGLIIKEMMLGVVLGTLLALPFWLFQSIGTIFDTQRGGMIGQQLNPMVGNDESPTGRLLLQTMAVLMIQVGAFVWLFAVLLDSYVLWPATHWLPATTPGSETLMVEAFSNMTRSLALYALPIIATMLLIEIGFAIISLYSPQLQVFFLAMPAKSLAGAFVLVVYATTLWTLGAQELEQYRGLSDILPDLFRADRR